MLPKQEEYTCIFLFLNNSFKCCGGLNVGLVMISLQFHLSIKTK